MACVVFIFFFFNDTATTEIYTLSLRDALPISRRAGRRADGGRRGSTNSSVNALRLSLRGLFSGGARVFTARYREIGRGRADRKSTRLNSSHANISYAVFCLKIKQYNNSNTHYT